MYESFFGLGDLPFRLTPDPRYLFMSAKHREAFAHLVYGIREGSGFVAITGEVGAGKTTLIRALLAEHATDVTVASIVNPVLTSTELLQTINAELGLPSRSTSRKELMEELAAFLKRNREAGRRTVIIVDEAQNLDPVVLEQLRLLSNLETETEKLLQVVLVGQPELHGILQRHDLRQLNQRVTERWHLDKLEHDEAVEYVRHRLRVAGAGGELIEPKALDLLYRFTDGVPRLLNILANRSLLVAFTRSRGRVGTDEVATAARELGYTPQVDARAGRPWGRAAGLGLATAAIAAVAYLLLSPLGDEDGPKPPASATGQAVGKASEKSPAARQARAPRERPARDDGAPGPDATPPVQSSVAAEPTTVAEPAVAVAPQAQPPAAASAASTSADADATTLAMLASGDVFESAVADYSRLLEAWQAAAVSGGDIDSGELNLEAIARARGLRYFAVELNDALLAVLDLPALVEMTPSPGGEVRYVLLRSLDRARGATVLGSGLPLALASFRQAWNGKAHIVFRDPEGLAHDLGPGSGGPGVTRLQAMLATAGVYDGRHSGLYDDLTENAVRRFQEASRVSVDGVAGPITQILLYNSLARFSRPRLAPGEAVRPAAAEGTS